MQLLQARSEVVWMSHDVTGEYVAHAAARHGMDGVIKWMLDRNPQVARQRTADGDLPWHAAQQAGHTELGDMLRVEYSRCD